MAAWAKVWTDGSCSQAGQATGPGGWAFVALEAGACVIERSGGGYPATTNQRMELKAVYEALLWARTEAEPGVLEIHSDSAYVVNCMNEEWWLRWVGNGWLNSEKKPVANARAWVRVLREYHRLEAQGCTVKFIKVKGHGTDIYNNRADELASAARKAGVK